MQPDSVPVQVSAAWVTATVAIVSLIVTVGLQVVFRFLDHQSKRKQAVLEKRQEALLAALQVVDHVYGNSVFDQRGPSHPHEWDLTLSHEAMNKMLIYCKNPERAVKAFMRAIGLHNPDTQQPRAYGPRDLEHFRNVVCEELELPLTNYRDKDAVWISKLPGSK